MLYMIQFCMYSLKNNEIIEIINIMDYLHWRVEKILLTLLYVCLLPSFGSCMGCRNLTTFDIMCEDESIVYILSGSPCQSNTTVTITMINKKTQKITMKTVTDDINDPIKLDDTPTKGVILDMHWNLQTDPKMFRKQTLHVMVKKVDLEEYKKANKVENIIISKHLYMFHDECDSSVKQNITSGFVRQQICNQALRLSEFSTLCYISTKNSKGVPLGIYITSFDTCTVPMSVTMVAFTETGDKIIERFTEDKTDQFIETKNSTCGFKLEMHDHTGDLYYIVMYHGCSNTDLVPLLSDHYYTELGMICPLANCKQVTPTKQTCEQNWISGKDSYLLGVSNVTLDICGDKTKIDYVVQIGKKDINPTYPFSRKIQLIEDHLKNWHDQGYAVALHIGYPPGWKGESSHPDKKNTGYLYLDLGQVSLYIHEVKKENRIHVLIIRHYPSKSDIVPLLHTEFYLRREDVCGVKSSNRSLVIGISVSVVALIFLLIPVIIIYRRRLRRPQKPGLPYQMHVGDDLEFEHEGIKLEE